MRRGRSERSAGTSRLLPAALAAALLASGCGIPGGRSAPDAPTERSDGPATVRVDNRSGFALSVYVGTQDGHRRRLGSMGSFETATFELAGSLLSAYSRFQLTAEPTGSSVRYASDPVLIRAGNVVTWTILTDQGRTTLKVGSGGG